MRRARRRLIIGSREIRLLDRHGPEQAWPLAPVARAERSILNGRLLLIGHSSEILAKLPGDLIGSNRRTKMLVSAINERLERHQLNTPD